jgi:hypothetical protein
MRFAATFTAVGGAFHPLIPASHDVVAHREAFHRVVETHGKLADGTLVDGVIYLDSSGRFRKKKFREPGVPPTPAPESAAKPSRKRAGT